MNQEIYKKWWTKSRRILRWVLSTAVIYLVITKIDFSQLSENFQKTDPALFFLALSLSPVLVVIGTFRWRFLLSLSHKCTIPLRFVFQHYWTGLALGFFAPASLGWDAYRVYVGGRHFGNCAKNMAIIIVEKFAALLTCMSIIVLLFPLTTVVVHSNAEKVFYLANILLVMSLITVGGVFTVFRSQILAKMVRRIEIYSAKTLEKIFSRLKIQGRPKKDPVSIKEILQSFVNIRILLILILSFGIQFVSAVKSQIFFNALGYDLPFLVNLLLAPTLYFIFLLPISFGSLGIREGVYIVLYGLFGVPAEIALLVSFFNLLGILLNNAIGAAVMFFQGEDKSIKAVK